MKNRSNSIFVSYKRSLYETTTEEIELEEIIDEIKSEKYCENIKAIRSSGKEKSQKLKNGLPIFYPSIKLSPYSVFDDNTFVCSTGIVQFDIDQYDNADTNKILLEKVNVLPETVYSFLSPRRGIKFAILTDFDCDDKSSIKRKYKIAFEKVYEFLKESGIFFEYDPTGSKITQGCYFSHDLNSFYNQIAIPLKINDHVKTEYEKEKINRLKIESKKISDIQFSQAEDDEVLDALSYIPTDLKYDKNRQGNGRVGRLEINGAIISHFGNRAENILLTHWTKKERLILTSQIKSQLKLNKITVGTLFREAELYGWKRPTPTGIHVETKETIEKGTYQSERLTKKEAEKKLSKLIQNFFNDKKNTIILYEAGAGKTRRVLEEIAKFNKNIPGKYIAIFVKSYALADEIDKKLNLLLGSKKIKNTRESFFLTSKIHKIQGMDRLCSSDDNLISLVGPELCKTCKYGFEYGEDQPPQCAYIRQYDHEKIFLNRIRIYTHSHLFHPSQFDPTDGFKPDYIIIDEDIIEAMTDIESNTISFSREMLPNEIEFIFDQFVAGQFPTIDNAIIKSIKENIAKVTDRLSAYP